VDLRYQRDTYNGFGETLARGFELAVTPAIFGAIGFGLDKWLGIVPVLTIVLLVLALCGMFVRMWFGYDEEMKRHEAEGPWATRRP
jgi:hypothetical protein